MQWLGTGKTLAKAFELGFTAVITRVRSASFRFLEMMLVDMIHKAAPATVLMKGCDRLSHSDTFLSALVKKINRHPALVEDYFEHGAIKPKERLETEPE